MIVGQKEFKSVSFLYFYTPILSYHSCVKNINEFAWVNGFDDVDRRPKKSICKCIVLIQCRIDGYEMRILCFIIVFYFISKKRQRNRRSTSPVLLFDSPLRSLFTVIVASRQQFYQQFNMKQTTHVTRVALQNTGL